MYYAVQIFGGTRGDGQLNLDSYWTVGTLHLLGNHKNKLVWPRQR